MQIILDNLGWPSVLTSVLKFWKKEAEVSISEWCHVRQTWGASASFVNEKKPQANECRRFLEAGKGKGLCPTLKHPEMSQPYSNVDFSWVWPISNPLSLNFVNNSKQKMNGNCKGGVCQDLVLLDLIFGRMTLWFSSWRVLGQIAYLLRLLLPLLTISLVPNKIAAFLTDFSLISPFCLLKLLTCFWTPVFGFPHFWFPF